MMLHYYTSKIHGSILTTCIPLFVYSRHKFSTALNLKQSNIKYCIDLIRKHDYENFLCLLFLPTVARNAAIAIRAFNVEIALIDESVSDAKIGAMRFQFWRDTLDAIYQNNPPEHPVAQELCDVVNKFKLSKLWLQRVIDSRETCMSSHPFSTVEDIEQYAENSVSPLYYLTLQAIGVQEVGCDHAASHLGRAYGTCTLLRSLAHHARPPAHRINLPQQLIAKYLLSEQAVLRMADHRDTSPVVRAPDDNATEKLRSVTYDIASVAHQHLSAAKSLRDKVPRDANPVFLPCVMVEWYLSQLRSHDFHVFHQGLVRRRHYTLPWALWRRSKRAAVL